MAYGQGLHGKTPSTASGPIGASAAHSPQLESHIPHNASIEGHALSISQVYILFYLELPLGAAR